jgi:hypothetical protein
VTATQTSAWPCGTGGVALGDVDGDGYLDVVTAGGAYWVDFLVGAITAEQPATQSGVDQWSQPGGAIKGTASERSDVRVSTLGTSAARCLISGLNRSVPKTLDLSAKFRSNDAPVCGPK